MQQTTQSWMQTLKILSERVLGDESGSLLWQQFQPLFSADYQVQIPPRHALRDMLRLRQLMAQDRLYVDLLKPDKDHSDYRLHFYSREQRYLDEFIPVLENLHLRVMDQVQFGFAVGGINATIKSFTVKAASGDAMPLNRIKKRLLATIQAVMQGRLENDPLNKLVTQSGMSWQACDVLRTYRNYCLQLNHWSSKAGIHHALLDNPKVAAGLFAYFEARFRPEPAWQDAIAREEQVLFPLRLQLLQDMASVKQLNDDRILRILFNLIDATVRSNFHRRLASDDFFIAIKINSLGVIDMPAPKPMYEIYLHAADMEGIHLRGGKVSRGGIRWSDRTDDFRTEILGLMQTQISKNALIIPTGAKGGFVVKNNGPQRDFKQAGQAAYIRFIRGLLDLTDNYQDDVIVSPPGIVTHDDPDPYIVVAADKGTAKFSDIANGVAAEYRFWLEDAFASGGSHGYDHKLLGITARGAWECVKRHFRELGKDIQSQPFTVIGIGSMDGDVFGNGMLLSPFIRLQAAFSGQHIFIDPSPLDDERSFNERRRLFELPGSNWDDYDRSLISAGGGVFARSDKDIPLSVELRQWLGVRYRTIDGESLIQRLLKVKVELLWLGGIGTYVKASSEKHEDVGDRNNDNVRVDACEISAMVVGEGANLGFTQKARIEYSLRGGRIDTDAVNNSAGVDTSDHEVNLKILLAIFQRKGLINDYQAMFMDMTPAVCQLVLANNRAQSQCLSLEQRRCAENPGLYRQIAERMENAGFLDRTVESFPSDKELQARPDQILTRPELAVLMAAGKMYLTEQLENHPALLENACHESYLQSYFPAEFRIRFQPHLSSHPLANPIKATMMSNAIINQAGCSFLGLDDDTDNEGIMAYVNSYLAFDQVLNGEALRRAVAGLDNQVSTDSQYRLLLQLEQTLFEFSQCSVSCGHNHCPNADTVSRYRLALSDYQAFLQEHADEGLRTQAELFQQLQIPPALAEKFAVIANLGDFLFMLSLANDIGRDFASLYALLQDIEQTLGSGAIIQQLAQIPHRDYWVKNICTTLQTDIRLATAELCKCMLSRDTANCAAFLDNHAKPARLKRYKKIYRDTQKISPVNLLAFVALVRALQDLLQFPD